MMYHVPISLPTKKNRRISSLTHTIDTRSGHPTPPSATPRCTGEVSTTWCGYSLALVEVRQLVVAHLTLKNLSQLLSHAKVRVVHPHRQPETPDCRAKVLHRRSVGRRYNTLVVLNFAISILADIIQFLFSSRTFACMCHMVTSERDPQPLASRSIVLYA